MKRLFVKSIISLVICLIMISFPVNLQVIAANTGICSEGCEEVSDTMQNGDLLKNVQEQIEIKNNSIEDSELQSDTDITIGEVKLIDRIEQYGITWYFDKEYLCGRYANGDYWVKTDDNTGKVTVTSITPEIIFQHIDGGEGICTGGSNGINACKEYCNEAVSFSGGSLCDGDDRGTGSCQCTKIRHGWEVNPHYSGRQAFDSRISGGDPDLVPPLPYTAEGGQSLVKVISEPDTYDTPGDGRECLITAAVLTIVDVVPTDNGATVFRPPYVGDDKRMYSINNLRTDLLPQLTAPDEAKYSLEWQTRRYQRVQLDHMPGVQGRALHAHENYGDGEGYYVDYGGDIGRDNGQACVILMLDDPLEDKIPLLINYVQYGIDIYEMMLEGHIWPDGGGHRPGMLLPLAFAAVMLDDNDMKNNVSSHERIYEDRILQYGEDADYGRGKVLFGFHEGYKEYNYWYSLFYKKGNRSVADPYGIIDGSYNMPGAYQYCCVSQPLKCSTLPVYLMPELRPVYNNENVLEYADRWVAVGTWTQPDPCAPIDGIIAGGPKDGEPCTMTSDPGEGGVCVFNWANYGKTYGADPDNPGMCILDRDKNDGTGRWPESKHNVNANDGFRQSGIVNLVWDKYRYITPYIAVDPEPYVVVAESNVTFTASVISNTEIECSWRLNGVKMENVSSEVELISGEDKIPHRYKVTLTLDNVQAEDAGKYSLKVSNSSDTVVVSKDAELTVISPPDSVRDFNILGDNYNACLSWTNLDGQGTGWNGISVIRKVGETSSGPDDGIEIYNGTGSSLMDRNLEEGIYHYYAYTYKIYNGKRLYSEPVHKAIEIPALNNKDFNRIVFDKKLNYFKIGQNTSGDLYTLWNTESSKIGIEVGGNKTDLWVYSDVLEQMDNRPTDCKVISASLVFNVEDCSFIQNDSEDEGNTEISDQLYDRDEVHSINIYRITDPSEKGMPYFADESGLRVGLDSNYRDHRPGINKLWINPEGDNTDSGVEQANRKLQEDSIFRLIASIEPIDSVEFNPAVISDGTVESIKFDITDAVQAWVDGEEQQGLYISTGQGWENNEYLVFSSLKTRSNAHRPYIEIIYAQDDGSVDLTPPAPVEDVRMIPGLESITLSWENPSDDFIGVKILKREGIVPFNEFDNDFVGNITAESYLLIDDKYKDEGLETGKTYYYAIYTYDAAHNYSKKVWVKAVPGAPASMPEQIDAVITAGVVKLSWNMVAGAGSYRIYRRDSSGNVMTIPFRQEISPTFTYNDYPVEGEYTYWITAVNENGEGPLSEFKSVTIDNNNRAENGPEGNIILSGELLSGSKYKLSWDYQYEDVSRFILERKTSNSEWQEIGSNEYNVREFVDVGLNPVIDYFYRIKAINSSGKSKNSNEISRGECDEPVAVKNISWEVISASQIKVTWEDTPNEESYQVILLNSDKEELEKVDISGNQTSCYFVTLEPGKEYRVQIMSVNSSGSTGTLSDIIRTSADVKGGLF